MMKKKGDSGKHRPVIAKKASKNISQEPEMEELKALLSQMDDEERQRTIEYLDEKHRGHGQCIMKAVVSNKDRQPGTPGRSNKKKEEG